MQRFVAIQPAKTNPDPSQVSMKIKYAFLVLVFVATFSFSRAAPYIYTGAGVAHFDMGRATKAFVEQTDAEGNAAYYQIGLGWEASDRLSIKLDFSDYSTATERVLHDYSIGIPYFVPNNELQARLQSFALSATYTWSLTPWFRITPQAGIMLSSLDSRWARGDFGQEDGLPWIKTADRDSGRFGYFFGLNAGWALSEHWRLSLDTRAIFPRTDLYLAGRLKGAQAGLQLEYRF